MLNRRCLTLCVWPTSARVLFAHSCGAAIAIVLVGARRRQKRGELATRRAQGKAARQRATLPVHARRSWLHAASRTRSIDRHCPPAIASWLVPTATATRRETARQTDQLALGGNRSTPLVVQPLGRIHVAAAASHLVRASPDNSARCCSDVTTGQLCEEWDELNLTQEDPETVACSEGNEPANR